MIDALLLLARVAHLDRVTTEPLSMIELLLATEAKTQGWQREVESHQATAKRLEQLLAELGESLEGDMADDVTRGNGLIEGNEQ